ncbi:DUF1870 family protein, partial [Shigella dysenteriae]
MYILLFISCSHYTMNAYELQALRHIFAMTIDECAPGLPRP